MLPKKLLTEFSGTDIAKRSAKAEP